MSMDFYVFLGLSFPFQNRPRLSDIFLRLHSCEVFFVLKYEIRRMLGSPRTYVRSAIGLSSTVCFTPALCSFRNFHNLNLATSLGKKENVKR